MELVFHCFLENLKKKPYLLPILSNNSRTICFQTGKGKNILYLSKKKQYMVTTEENVHFYIRGQEDSLTNLLMGKEKLQTLVKEEQIHVEGSFRDLLYLESLFLLNQPYLEGNSEKRMEETDNG
ncbi:SCP2 sterol-binding domain-containing protein [Peribacillus deserti]|uniref:SCP2 domain-containing protein n=1 Tax=Peribacillus deserti TaxID=673318 RepID=A0A2N5M150_9BACI|nr:hypothetical protein [Peribacillus deserti]PLT28079.1 hypothetical protein CUU66_20505 [Peribacillus deserti]